MRSVNLKKVGIFLAITFSINWAMALIFYLAGGKWMSPQGTALGLAYMLVPMYSAIIVQKWIYKEPLKEPLGILFKINRWWLLAWTLPVVLSISAFGLALLYPDVSYSHDLKGNIERYSEIISQEQIVEMEKNIQDLPVHPFWVMIGQGMLAGISINAIAGFGEELGWRGFLQNEFQSLGFWPMSFLIGIIWGLWHSPVILMGHNYPEHPVIGVFMMIVFCILIAPVLSYIRIQSKSVVAASIFHGTINGTAGLGIVMLKGGNDLTVGLTGFTGFMILLVLNIILMFLVKKDTLGINHHDI